MTNRHPHLIVAVHADLDVDFALVPITGSLVRILANQLKDIRGHGSLAEAAFWDGHPVFFEKPEDDFCQEKYRGVGGRPDVHWRHFKCTRPHPPCHLPGRATVAGPLACDSKCN